MPCNCDGYPSANDDMAAEYRLLIPAMCAVMEKLEKEQCQHWVPPLLHAWWTKHQEIDREKKVKEESERNKSQIRKTAIEKLSSDELLVLGLVD